MVTLGAITSVILIFAQEATNSSGGGGSDLPLLAQYGLLAPLLAALFWAYRREASRADRLEEEVRRLNTAAQEKTLPALFEVTSSMRDMAVLARDLKMRTEIEKEVAERQRNKAGE